MYKIGMLYGSFDLFGYGHLMSLRMANSLCSRLVVCVSTDEYIEEKNGYLPIVPFYQRFKIVMANKYVDDVDMQSNDFDKIESIKRYNPDVIFIGDNRKIKFKKDFLYGLPVIYLPYERGVSLKLLRKRLKGQK